MVTRAACIYEGRYVAPVVWMFGRRFWLPPLAFLTLYWVFPFVSFLLSGSYGKHGLPLADLSKTYLSDFVHLAFAVNSSILVLFGYSFIRLLQFRMTDVLRNSAGVGIPLGQLEEFARVANFPFSLGSILAATILSGTCLVLLLQRVFQQDFDFWWGNIAFGYGGIAYAVVTSVFVFLSVKYILLLAILSHFLVRFSFTSMRLRPFHPDGVSGLGSFGSLMISVWMQTLLLSFALLIVVQSNYLSLMDNYFTWLLGGAVVIVAPLAAIVPFSTTVLRARKLKRQLIFKVLKGRFPASQANNQVIGSKLIDFVEARKALESITVFPFLSLKFICLLGFNAIQLYLALGSIMSGFETAP